MSFLFGPVLPLTKAMGSHNHFLTPDKKEQQPTGGIEPPTFRLQSECSTTKLSRHVTRYFQQSIPPRQKDCVARELNPDLLLGRQQC
jgi:hypothetical protein